MSFTILGKQEFLKVFNYIIPTDFNSAQKKTDNKHVGIIIDLYRKYVRYLTVLESTQEIDELDTAIKKYWYRYQRFTQLLEKTATDNRNLSVHP